MEDRNLDYDNVKYGMLVEVLSDPKHHDSGYHAGMKVHFFNKKGVLVGNIYEFLPYDRLRLRDDPKRYFPRNFMDERFETVKSWLFKQACQLVTFLIRNTQKYMHKF